MYNVGWPAARLLGRLGVPLEVRVYVEYDPEAKVFVGTSNDIEGLVVEAATLDEMAKEIGELVPMMLVRDHKPANHKIAATMSYTSQATPCA